MATTEDAQGADSHAVLRTALAEALARADFFGRYGTTPEHATLRSPFEWARRATSLMLCAGELATTPRITSDRREASAVMMLVGMSVEVALKGAVIARSPGWISNIQYARIMKLGHNLTAIASEAGLTTLDGDAPRLLELTEYVRWAGRYPTAKSLAEHEMAQAKLRPLGVGAVAEHFRLASRCIALAVDLTSRWAEELGREYGMEVPPGM